MGVEDFRIHVAFPDHPKTVKLIRRLGLAGPWALVKLWAWATPNRPTGELLGMSDEDIEIAAGWAGEAGALVAALVEVGYLDRTPDCCMLHDWRERQPWVVDAPGRSARAVHGGHCRQGVAFSLSCPVCKSPAGRKRPAQRKSAGARKPLSPSPLLSSPLLSKETTSSPASPPTSPPPPSGTASGIEVVDAWNQITAGVLPAVRELTDERRRKIKARSAVVGRDLAWWREYFRAVAAAPFLRGENDRGWKADLDYAIRNETVVARILEGSFARSNGTTSRGRPPPRSPYAPAPSVQPELPVPRKP